METEDEDTKASNDSNVHARRKTIHATDIHMKKLIRAVFKAHIKDGKLEYDNPGYMRTIIFGYEDTGKVRVIVEKDTGKRTNKQNAYYWLVLGYIAEYIGEIPEDTHETMKAKFLKKRRVWRGMEMTVLKSTTQLTSDEMGEYIDRVIREGAELGVAVPQADKNYDLIETTRTD